MNDYCPLIFTPACTRLMCVGILCLFSYHLPVLDPLVESLVTCQRLTSLELIRIVLFLQNWMTLVKGLHNLRALGLKKVFGMDERVSY